MSIIQKESTLTCPHCGYKKAERHAQDYCQIFYECEGCGEVLRPRKGHFCVFCTYGTVPCPPIQEAKAPRSNDSVRCR